MNCCRRWGSLTLGMRVLWRRDRLRAMSRMVRTRVGCAALVFAALSAGALRVAGQAPAAAPPTPLAPNAPFTVAVATAVVEAATVYMAKEGPFGSQFQYINGGVRTLQNNG